MASNPYRKLIPGERLEAIPAGAWNGFIDVANAYREGRIGDPRQSRPDEQFTGRTICRVRNDSEQAVDRFSIMEVLSFGIAPGDNLGHFKNVPYLSVDLPATDLTSVVGGTAFVITQAPIAAGAVGPALIAGVSPVQIDVLATGATTADLIVSDETQLQTAPWGCADIIVPISSDGWAYVLLHGFARRPWFGITDESIADGGTGTVSAYIGGSDSGLNAECVAGFGAIGSGKLVYVVPRSPEWYAVQAPCPAT